MDAVLQAKVTEAKQAALDVLLHNAHGPFYDLPRTAGWGYPEPYTRDLMIAALGMLASGNEELREALRRVLVTLAQNQTAHGHISSLAHNPEDLGASDTTPLFLMTLAIYRQVTGEADFLDDFAQKALTWMEYQSPDDKIIVGQQPTSDWRDEQWVLGFGLFVNTVVYTYLRLLGQHPRADGLRQTLGYCDYLIPGTYREGLSIPDKPYYALWAYKIYNSERFDLLGNSLAVISGLASPSRQTAIVEWVETEIATLQDRGELAVNFPPNLFPFLHPTDPDWIPRYQDFNLPGEYHNGGIWPFIGGFYVVALVASGFPELAEERLGVLTDLVRLSRDPNLSFGFNEWIRAQDGTPQGQDWQTWSAAMYLYAATCVEQGRPLYFEEIRKR